jgi:hypothetical protein
MTEQRRQLSKTQGSDFNGSRIHVLSQIFQNNEMIYFLGF